MSTFTMQMAHRAGRCGGSLRGCCQTAADVQQLEQSLDTLCQAGGHHIWLDCRRLEAISYQAQRAMLLSDTRARAAGQSLYWCGVLDNVLLMLRQSGLDLLLHLSPATSYQGPAELLG